MNRGFPCFPLWRPLNYGLILILISPARLATLNQSGLAHELMADEDKG